MIKDIESLVLRVSAELRDFADFAVLGLSGGADSTLVACLCKIAFGEENIHSLHMPYNKTDQSTFNSRSLSLAHHLKISAQVVHINTISDAITQSLRAGTSLQLSQVNEGNARSRARMCVLYGTAHCLNDSFEGEKRVRVIGTGNLSEDFIGYDTKGGDALCDIFPIGSLFKSEVYQLLDYFREKGMIGEEHIDRVPSAGLWEGQTDESELGYSYNTMEEAIRNLEKYPSKPFDPNSVEAFVRNRNQTNKHKHEAPPVINLRSFCD